MNNSNTRSLNLGGRRHTATRGLAIAAIALMSATAVWGASTSSYVQAGLIACWDGIENAGVGVHDSSATVWKDLVAEREFALHGVTVNADRMTFAGAATSYGNLSATDTTATFVAATNGTLEIVYAASVSLSDSRVLLQSPGTSGFCFSVKPSQITGANASSGAKGKIFSFTSGTATNSASIRYDKGLPESALCNGASVSASGTDYWNVSGSETVIGTRAAKSGYHFPGSIYCIRLYNRRLTDDEIAANHNVDEIRFILGDPVGLRVTGSPSDIGSPSPAYGETNGVAAGESFTVSCGATSVTNAAGSVQYSCTGWKLYDETDVVVSSGVETSFTYTHPNPAEYRRLEWQWVASPITDAITRLDETAYAPDGLVVNFDALRNAGASAPRDPSATNWVDLVSGRTATLTRIAADPDQESDPGCWTKDAYRFAGHTYFLFDEALNLGSSWTVQLACDVENPDSYADPMKGNYGIFGATYGMRLWKGGGNQTAQYFLDVYADQNNYGRSAIWNWDGKRATLMRENGNMSMSFSETRVAPATTSVDLGASATPLKQWMIGNYNGSLAGALVGRVHAVRIYSHALTQEEISRNWMVDNARFHGIATAKNMVVVASGLPGAEGTEAVGAYLVAGSHTFTAPQSVTMGGNTYACTGYSLEPFDSNTGFYTVWGGATESSDRSYTFTETWDGTPSVRLTWQWTLIDGVERYDVSSYPQHGLVAHFDGIRNAGAVNAHDSSAITWHDISGNGLHATNFVVDAALDCGSWTNGNGYCFVTNDQFRTSSLLELGPQFTWQIATTLASDVSNAKYYRPFSSSDVKTYFSGRPYSQQSFFYCRSQGRGGWNWAGKYVNAARNNTVSGWTDGAATPSWQDFSFDQKTTGVNRWIIGGSGSMSYPFKGTVHSVRVYDRLLTTAEFKKTREIDDIRFRGSVPATNTVFVATALEGAEGDQECGIYRVAGAGHAFTATERRRIDGRGYVATCCIVETWNATTKKWEDPVSSTGSTWTTPAGGSWPSRRITWYWSIPGMMIFVR